MTIMPSSPFDAVHAPRRAASLGYTVGAVGVVAATLTIVALRPYITDTMFLVPFLAAVFAAAWLGGVRPGIATTALAVLVNQTLLTEPFLSFRLATGDLIRLGLFTVVALVVVVLVAARNRALGLVAEQREWLVVTLESAGDALVVTDAEGKLLFLNRIAERIMGWTSAELRGRPLAGAFRILNENTRQPVADPVGKVIATGRAVGLANHTVLITRSGREVPIDDSAAPVTDAAGRVRGVVLLFRDVTKRRTIERTLAEQADQLRQQAALVEQALDPIFSRDLEHKVVFWNRAADQLYGWSREEAVGRDVHQLLSTEFPEPIESVERRIRETGVWEGVIVHTCRDGRRVIEESRHVLVRRDDGQPFAILEINRDITERRRAEDERERALAEAREANRLKDDFLTTLSHELRTPLNAILGWSQILAQASLDPETQRRAIRTIARNAEAQSQLIADVLDVSRIVSGKMRLSIKSVDLTRLAVDALDSVRPAAEAKGITLRHSIEGPSLWVSADPDRLQQILWNLLTNAIKFTPRGGEVSLELVSTDSRVRMSVRDTGVGITPDFLPRVFERFSQRDSSTTRTHGGLGLGLAIVRHLAEAHGGSVVAQSDGENRGATFSVVLPIRAVHREAEQEAAQLGAGGTAPPEGLALQGLRVLVVDDEEDARELIGEVLARHGAQVRTAADADGGLEALQSEPTDLLVADIGMPGRDGYDLIRQVRRLPPSRGGNVIALAVTAYGRPEDRLRALAAGYQQHLAKPVMPGELVLVAASLFQRADRQADAARPVRGKASA